MKKILRHIIGYIVGISIFWLLVPRLLYEVSLRYDQYLQVDLFGVYPVRMYIAVPIFFIGLIFVCWSNVTLIVIGKGGPTEGFNIPISPRTRQLVVVGPYRYSRNPMVFGIYLVYLGISIFFNSIICIALLFVLFFLTIIYLKLTEEKRLLKDFGNVFIEYKRRVPMIIPFPKRLKSRKENIKRKTVTV